MRQWMIRRARLKAFTPHTRPSITVACAKTVRGFSVRHKLLREVGTVYVSSQNSIFRRISTPSRDERLNPAAWAALLEPGLPPHLRVESEVDRNTSLNAEDIAEVLLAARGPRTADPSNGIDLLSYLGLKQDRWGAVVWLVKHLVDAFGPSHVRPGRLSKTLLSWKLEKSLDTLTEMPIQSQDFAPQLQDYSTSYPDLRTLNEITGKQPDNLSRKELLRQDALGQIWRSLGYMTISCADGEIKPEILEIIAYLHHVGIMPASIYSQRPSSDATVVQQPVMLSLLSSRILISLSDAAWRVREKLLVEEVKQKGGNRVSMMPHIPLSAYKVHVAGLRPEVWIELILWSCLHGGWITDGTAILNSINTLSEAQAWRSLSWRSLVGEDESQIQDWDKLEYLYRTQTTSALDDSKHGKAVSVHRTISSEVVNAYVDALLSIVRVGVGERGENPAYVLLQLNMLRKFLRRGGPSGLSGRDGLGLASGSWDAIVMRFIDSQEAVIAQTGNLNQLVALSPSFGENLGSTNVQHLPAYVLDGSAAIVGIFHRALRSKVNIGDVQGALALFNSLQARTDNNMRRSLADFLSTRHRQLSTSDECDPGDGGMFTSNFAGIDYPAFHSQVPATILGSLLELTMDSKLYDFGKRLLYSEDVDGPLVSEDSYMDPSLAPVLVRFAAETSDTVLLSKLVAGRTRVVSKGESRLPKSIIQSFFDSQINLRRWNAAKRILQHMASDDEAHWNIVNLAQVAKMMLFQVQRLSRESEEESDDLQQAKALFADMVQRRYERQFERPDHVQRHITQLLTVLSVLNSNWARFCLALQVPPLYFVFTLPTRAFNLVLEGIVEAYGSATGRRVLGIVWPHSVRRAQRAGQHHSITELGERLSSKHAPNGWENPDKQRTVITFPGHPEARVSLYGGVRPDMMTIRIILRKSLEEFKNGEHEQDQVSGNESAVTLGPISIERSADSMAAMNDSNISATDMIVWAVHCLRLLGMSEDDVKDELGESLSTSQMASIEPQLYKIFERGNADAMVEQSDDHRAESPHDERRSHSVDAEDVGSKAYRPII